MVRSLRVLAGVSFFVGVLVSACADDATPGDGDAAMQAGRDAGGRASSVAGSASVPAGGAEAGSPPDAGADGGTSGAGAPAVTDGGASAGDGIAEQGSACEPPGKYACVSHASKARLVCDVSNKWVASDDCPQGSFCDTAAGVGQGRCRAIVPGCADKEPGSRACAPNQRALVECGPDLVTAVTTQCSAQGKCAAGACQCNDGFSGDGVKCDDVDECATDGGGCAPEADCLNTTGGHDCVCKAGYSGDGKTCADVDECLVNHGGCAAEAVCENTPGARTCTCAPGYTGDGVSCADVDECATNNGGCAKTATCTNEPGAAPECKCKAGYAGDGVTCADIDECASGNGGCDANATCANKPGTRTCTCKAGFTGDGKTCADIDECTSNNGGCSGNATCKNTAGGRSCTCKSGYGGDGVTCNDIDECASNNGGCSPNASCSNTSGSRSCACKAGYSGDGVSCGPNCASRYVVPGNGTVYDTQTALTWQQSVDTTTRSRQDAANYCSSIGYRLPTRDELLTLVEPDSLPTINACAFPNTPYQFTTVQNVVKIYSYWTSTYDQTYQCNAPNPASCSCYSSDGYSGRYDTVSFKYGVEGSECESRWWLARCVK